MSFLRLTASASDLLIAALEGVAAADISEPTLGTAVPAMREIALVGFTRALAEAPLVAETDGRVQMSNGACSKNASRATISAPVGWSVTAPGLKPGDRVRIVGNR